MSHCLCVCQKASSLLVTNKLLRVAAQLLTDTPTLTSFSTEPVGPTTTATAHTATTHTAAAHSFQTSHQGTQGIEGEEEGDDRKGEERGWALKRQVAHLADTLAGVADPTDRLTVLEVIGQGAFGLVFRGRWRNLDVAVKTVGGDLVNWLAVIAGCCWCHGAQSLSCNFHGVCHNVHRFLGSRRPNFESFVGSS